MDFLTTGEAVRLGERKLYERLDFVPLLFENFDLLMRQRSYFRPSIQALIGFLGEKRLKQRAAELTGYDPTPSGQIRFAA
jgi:putative molybdopterin biosynthesis protein